VFLAEFGQYPAGANPDEGPELMAMSGTGADVQQLTVNGVLAFSFEPDITAGGTRVVYREVICCGHDAYGLSYLDLDGSDPVSVITDDRDLSFETAAITADGETIVFMSYWDLAGTDPCTTWNQDVFRVQADGTGLAQMTFAPSCGQSGVPSVAANGSVVVLQSSAYGPGPGDLFSIPLGGGPVTPVVEDGDSYYKQPWVSADGSWAAWQAGVTDLPMQVFRGRTDGSLVEMLTDDPDQSSNSPDISGDGRLVAYRSSADPLGTNPDHNSEIFLYDAETRSLQQLTVTSEGYCSEPRISDDGAWVYFCSGSPFFGPDPGDPSLVHVFRVNATTAVTERAGGLSDVPSSGWSQHPYLTVDADGGRAAFVSRSAPTGEPLPRTYDLWLSDFDTPATIRPGADAPTVVEWDPDPRAVSYDVIRGDVANLAVGPGNTVDLGAVVCLENDTFNTNTAGAEADAVQPDPGQVFFFLRRWTQGPADGLGSYGQGSGEAERAASAGDCPQ
jgi:Tol biopolymer transport system component